MKSSKTSFLRNCISGWNVRCLAKRRSSLCFRIFVRRGGLFLQMNDDNHLLWLPPFAI